VTARPDRPTPVWVAAGLALIGVFAARQLRLQRTDAPLLDLRILLFGTYTKALILMSVAFLAMLGSMILLPLYLQNLRGLSPLQTGLLVMPGGLAMGLLGERVSGRDVAIGMVLSLSLGLGLLFLHFYTAFATQATSLLFGNVFSVDHATVLTLAVLGALCLASLALMARPLLFATLQPDLAEAKGVSLRLVSVLFMAIVAVAVAEAAQIVGVLLVFTLMVGPAAAAQRLTTRLSSGLLLTVLLGLGETWLGITLAYQTDWPSSFWIAALSGLVYFASLGWARINA